MVANGMPLGLEFLHDIRMLFDVLAHAEKRRRHIETAEDLHGLPGDDRVRPVVKSSTRPPRCPRNQGPCHVSWEAIAFTIGGVCRKYTR